MSLSKLFADPVNQDGTDPGNTSEGNLSPVRCDVQGNVFANIGHPYGFFTATSSGGSTAGAGLVAAVTGMAVYVTDIILSALTTCTFTLREDTTTVTFLSIDMGFTAVLGGETWGHSFRQPIKTAVGKPLQYTATDKVKVNLSGYYAP